MDSNLIKDWLYSTTPSISALKKLKLQCRNRCKTFSIELIYSKSCCWQLKLEVQQILLVTFTVEATQQMKKRIFEVLQRCSDFFDNKKQTPYFPLQQFLERVQHEKKLA